MMDVNLPAHYSLYQLNQAYLEALHNIEIDENGEVIGGEHLDLLKDAIDQKIQNYAHMYLIWETELEAVKKEKHRIESIRLSLETKMYWAKKSIQGMIEPGVKIGRISWRKSTALEIDEGVIDEIPAEYVVQELKPLKEQIKLALSKGEIIPGCRLITNQNIQIK